MGKSKLEFVWRRPVAALIHLTPEANGNSIAAKLPEGYVYENGAFRFPAGVWTSYFVNGKEYNVDGGRSIEEQKESIVEDLQADGFSREEALEFIDNIEITNTNSKRLNNAESDKWLKTHPEFEVEAIKKLDEARVEARKELQKETGRQFGRK
ncbi:MAG: hypothetical protein V1928_01355 [Parcubacteria group bacterium]